MKKMTFAFIIIAVFFLFASFASAHQPRIVTDKITVVQNPEVSQAFYGELEGTKNVFEISSSESFDLYASLLVPDMVGTRKDFSVEIYQQEDFPEDNEMTLQKKTTTALLNGIDFNWSNLYEPWLGDSYFQGPEFRSDMTGGISQGVRVEPGVYLVQVFNPDNEGKYVLVIGTKEEFSLSESINTIKILPTLKSDFFGKSSLLAFWSLTGLYLLFVILMVVLIVWIVLIIFGKNKRDDNYLNGSENPVSSGNLNGEKK